MKETSQEEMNATTFKKCHDEGFRHQQQPFDCKVHENKFRFNRRLNTEWRDKSVKALNAKQRRWIMWMFPKERK